MDASTESPQALSLTARRPGQLLAADDMNVEMVDTLAALWSVVDDYPKALCQSLVIRDLGCNKHEMPQELLVLFSSLAQSSQPVSAFGNHEDVGWSLQGTG